MSKRNRTATFDVAKIVLDLLVIIFCFILTDLFHLLIFGLSVFSQHTWVLYIFSVIFIMSMFIGRMYNVTTFYYADRVILRAFFSTVIGAVSVSFVAFMLRRDEISRTFYLMFCVLVFVLVFSCRIFFRLYEKKHGMSRQTRTIFIGRGYNYEKYSRFVKKTGLHCDFVASLRLRDECLESPEAFEKYLVEKQIDEVAMDYCHNIPFEYEAYMKVCDDMGITVRLVLDMFEMPVSEMFINSIGTFPVVTYHSVSMNRTQLFVKAVMDISVALVATVLSLPLMLVTAIAIKLESPGPALFVQKRVGINGKVFNIYKFRSMYMDAEERKKELMALNKIASGHMFKIDNDPRITKVGMFIRKTSIDELPQLFNVLKRDMSLVGTRPPTIDEVECYERRHRRRISIRPGITGMWQVSGRSNVLDFEDVVRLDTSYIDNWSVSLDIKLLLRTVRVVLKRDGSY